MISKNTMAQLRKTAHVNQAAFSVVTTRLAWGMALAGALALSGGCTSPSVSGELAEIEAARHDRLVELRDETDDNIPDWYLENSEAVTSRQWVGRGTARSTDLQTAIDHAVYLAQLEIARQAHGRVSELMRSHRVALTTDENISHLIETTSERFVPETDTGSARVLRKKVVPEGTGFRAFVLMHMDIDEAEMRKHAAMAMAKAQAELAARNADFRAAAIEPLMPVLP